MTIACCFRRNFSVAILRSQYSIAVGSTVGQFGGYRSHHERLHRVLKATVHMSADARARKAKVRSHGVTVVEYEDDYGVAVEQGRKAAQSDPNRFIDDENSRTLYFWPCGSGSASESAIAQQGRVVDASHPLLVYLPCGVGGGPAASPFGLKLAFGDNVHCLCRTDPFTRMLLGVYTGLHDAISAAKISVLIT